MSAMPSTDSSPLPPPIKLLCPLQPNAGPPLQIPDVAEMLSVVQDLFGVPVALENSDDGLPSEQGCFNSLYVLRLEKPPVINSDLDKVVVRIAGERKTQSDISLESEVATMTFVREHTSIPLPTVFAYCTDSVNAIGRPFIIMSHISGICMESHEWDDLGLDVKLRTVRSYAQVVTELMRHTFDSIGSLYYSHPADSRSLNPPDKSDYMVGPVAWAKMRSDIRKMLPVYDRGPWTSAHDWMSAALKDELQFMRLTPDVALGAHGLLDKSIEDSFQSALKALPEMLKMVPAVTDDKWSRGPFNLSHADLAPPNILVEPSGPNAGTISAVVDWEMASTAPLWELICYPDWFEKEVPWCDRDEATARAFMGTYVDEMRRLGHSEELLGLIEQGGWRRRFTEIALQPWLAIDLMENWLKSNNR